MNSRMFVSLAMATMSLIFAAGCTSDAKKKSVKQTESKVSKVDGTNYTTIIFDKGQTELSSTNKENLKRLAVKAHKQGKAIEEIKILAWADKEYPDKIQSKGRVSDVILAKERALRIKNYLEKDLKESSDIDSYNMAKRPDLLSKMLRDDEYAIKDAFETSGATGSKLPDGSVSYTKASKAIVIIGHEGDEDKFK